MRISDQPVTNRSINRMIEDGTMVRAIAIYVVGSLPKKTDRLVKARETITLGPQWVTIFNRDRNDDLMPRESIKVYKPLWQLFVEGMATFGIDVHPIGMTRVVDREKLTTALVAIRIAGLEKIYEQ